MANRPADTLTITSEHFLAPLGLPELNGGSSERRRELFIAIVEFLATRDLLDERATPADRTPDELHLRVPGTPVHVRLGAIGEPELREIVALVGGLGLIDDPKTTITLTGLLALSRLVQKLRTEYGERSIVEAIKDAQPRTAAAITGILHGAPCRHPSAGCRFAVDRTCGIELDTAAATLENLVERNVLRRLNAAEPYEYAVRR